MTVIKINPDKFELKELQPAVAILQQGGVIAYPTETVYGLGANIYHEKAVRRIFEIKGRDPQKPLSIMVSSIQAAEELCGNVPDFGNKLMAAYWPGPLTLIFQAANKLPKYIVSVDKKIGLRFPDHPITGALMRLHREPVTSTSANISGQRDPVRASEVIEAFAKKVDLIIDGGECQTKIPSTVVDVSGSEPVLVRAGAIPFAEIMKRLSGVAA
jgi:L-threonylcarbamoyladenylate synthase